MGKNFKPVVYAALFVIVFTIIGFRVGHPNSGLRSAAGPASSSLVIYRDSNSYAVGDKVIFNLEDSSLSPAIGIVRLVQEQQIQIQTENLVIDIPLTSVRGKLYGVLPFIGLLFSFF